MVFAVNQQRAIRETYKGVTYRSRLEARYAVFFDSLGTDALYEYEGFKLASGLYLPDFYLPNSQTWLEIKPDVPSDVEKQRCRDLCAFKAQRVILAYGPFGYWLPELCLNFMQSAYCYSPSLDPNGEVVCFGEDTDYEPCVCPTCGAFGFEFEGRGARVCRSTTNCCGAYDRGHTGDTGVVREAAEKALAWSFWK